MNISIKNPPDKLVQRLKERAERHKRTPEDEALLILEEALLEEALLEEALGSSEQPSGAAAVVAELRKLGLSTPADAVQIIRHYRDR